MQDVLLYFCVIFLCLVRNVWVVEKIQYKYSKLEGVVKKAHDLWAVDDFIQKPGVESQQN